MRRPLGLLQGASLLLARPRDSGVPLPVLNPSSVASPWVDLGKRTAVSKAVSSPMKWTLW